MIFLGAITIGVKSRHWLNLPQIGS